MGRRRKKRGGGRVTPKGTRPRVTRQPARPAPTGPGDPFGLDGLDLDPSLDDAFLADLRDLLTSDHPLDLLFHASTILDAVDPRNDDPFAGRTDRLDDDGLPPLDRAAMVQALSGDGRTETDALLAAIAALGGDEVERRRIGRHLQRTRSDLPGWLADLEGAAVERAARITQELGDEEDVVLSVRLSGGHVLTAVVRVDHNAGGIVRDGFVVDRPADAIATIVAEKGPPPDGPAPAATWADVDPAEARARITAAIDRGAMTIPRTETDAWPASRPLVEWMCRRAPDTAPPPEPREWSDEEQQAIADRFLTSPLAQGLDADAPDLVDSLLWFGCGYGPGDPLRWSPTSVEIFLLDWVPRKILQDPAVLAKMPAVLRAFVAFAHAESGVRPALTETTLATVGECEPEYRRLIADAGRPMGPRAVLAAMGFPDPTAAWEATQRQDLVAVVGGEDALEALDDVPLPDEPFAWDGVPDGAQDRTALVLELTDEACDALFDREVRTACRRLLARLAAERPDLLTGRGQPATAAWAVCWIVGTANDVFSSRSSCFQGRVKDLTAHLGLTAPANARAATFLKALGIEHEPAFSLTLALGTPDLLTSCRRRQIVRRRDRR